LHGSLSVDFEIGRGVPVPTGDFGHGCVFHQGLPSSTGSGSSCLGHHIPASTDSAAATQVETAVVSDTPRSPSDFTACPVVRTAEGRVTTLDGGGGNDRIFGGNARARLLGGDDDDEIVAGTLGDELTGGRGRDLIVGGLRADRFVFETALDSPTAKDGQWSPSSGDTIVAFRAEDGDKLDLGKIAEKMRGALRWSTLPEQPYGVWLSHTLGDTYVYVETSGDRRADLGIRLIGDLPLTSTDFCGIHWKGGPGARAATVTPP
jgi:hypothetical protein